MKDIIKRRNITRIFQLSIILLIATVVLLSLNIYDSTIAKRKPSDILVGNTSTTQTDILWKGDKSTLLTLSYKEENSTKPFKKVEDYNLYNDNISGKYLYYTTIKDLEPNTTYTFRIDYKDNVSKDTFTFRTKDIDDEIEIPEIVTGTQTPQSFIQVNTKSNTYILNTQYHGTYAFDSQKEGYTVKKYANYTSKEELKESLFNSITTPVYAESGANCKTGVSISSASYAPSKEKVVDILNRWVQSCPKGGYPSQCYEDLYCKSVSNGVDPGFAFAIWSNESGGSNYAHSSNVEDFGIHSGSVPKRDFTAQSDFFLKNIAGNEGYISSCTGKADNLTKWGARFWKGDCNSDEGLKAGKEYITQIGEVYSWYTNKSLQWPMKVSGDAGCNYSSSVTNSVYNNCDGSSTGSNTPKDPTPSTTTPSTSTKPTGGDGARDEMIMFGERHCQDIDGCQCLYDYDGLNAKTRVNINYGYTCTMDRRVIKTENICCKTKTGLVTTLPYNCDGQVLANISVANCKAETIKYTLEKGVNFVQAITVLNQDLVPVNTAKGLISHSQNKIIAVGLFRNNSWSKVVKYENGTINGTDFNLEPGESYMIISLEKLDIEIMGYKGGAAPSITTMVGWNLVPSSIFSGKANTSIDILQSTEFANISQIAQWDRGYSLFEYTLKNNKNEVYGENLKIAEQEGIFIKAVKK